MIELSIDVPAELQEWINTRLAEGRHVDASDYIRDLIRRDQDAAQDETEWLREMIRQGEQSGIIEKDAREVLRDIIAERPAKRA